VFWAGGGLIFFFMSRLVSQPSLLRVQPRWARSNFGLYWNL